MLIISIHLFPHEIKNFQRIVENLNNAIKLVSNKDEIILNVSLNNNPSVVDANVVDMPNLTRIFYECESMSKIKPNFKIICDTNFLGVNEHRRSTIAESNNSDYIIFLDCDLYFDNKILAHQLNALKIARQNHDLFIISPQIVKLWDNTWDCIVNEQYLNESHQYHKQVDPNKIIEKNHGEVSLTSCDDFKWGGGWFNVISANLLKQTGIPKSFIGYGPDDTFTMECCKHMKLKNINVQQYILKNMIVVEDRFYRKPKSSLRKDIINFRENANKHFYTELSFFKKKINDNIYNHGL
jgi:hypothetical protein